MEPITIKLDYPVQYGSETISEVTITRRMQVKDLKGTGMLDDTERGIKLVERLTGQPPKVVEELDAIDFQRISGIIESFLSPSPVNGKE